MQGDHWYTFLYLLRKCRSIEKLCDLSFKLLHIVGRFESADDIAFTVNKELREVPLDLGILLIVLIHLQ